MKFNVTDKPKRFSNIYVKIVLENEKDLCDLWHRLNIPIAKLREQRNGDKAYPPVPSTNITRNTDLFRAINKYVEEYNLKGDEND